MLRQSLQSMALLLLAAMGLSVALLISTHSPQEDETAAKSQTTLNRQPTPQRTVKSGDVPKISLSRRARLTRERSAQIKSCIARLADIEKPDFGLSPTMSGRAFLPLPSQRQSSAMILMDHNLASSAALQTLVEIGPEALPFLLEALGDKTPTKLKLEHRSVIGSMWFANELWGNPVNELEMKTLGPRKDPFSFDDEKHVEEYTVKVGDICLVAIGQIVGRGYQTVRYQPTACIVINSPTEDRKLRDQVRKIWASDEPARKLLDSLLLDFATEGVFNGHSLDGWYLGSELKCEAALRLLYYYPKETSSLIADRLRRLDIAKTSERGHGSPATETELDAFMRRQVANGVRTDDFIQAVSWCPERKMREAIEEIFARTDDIDNLLAALPGVDDPKLVQDRLNAFLNALPVDEGAPYGDGYNLLVALAERVGDGAAPSFEQYLNVATVQRCHTVAEALQQVRGGWCVRILVPLLGDKRPTDGYTYAIHGKKQDKRLPIRVCDAAAETLQLHDPRLEFELEGEHEELDKKIQAIRNKLTVDD